MAQQSSSVVPLHATPLSEDEQRRASLTDFATVSESELPVSTQLEWKLRSLIARGALRDGDRMPSVREMATFAGVNVNTARAVYASLEEEGAISSERGRGTFVAAPSPGVRRVGELADRTLIEARERGVDPAALAAALWSAAEHNSAEDLPDSPIGVIDSEAGDAVVRRELRLQIARLEAELAAHAWNDPAAPVSRRVETAAPVPRLVTTEELQVTRDELISRLMRLRGEEEGRGAREQLAREHLEAMLENPAEHQWEIVSSTDSGGPGAGSWRVVPRFGPFGAILGWWRVKATSR